MGQLEGIPGAQGAGWVSMLIIPPPGKAPPAPTSSPRPGQWSHGPQGAAPPILQPPPRSAELHCAAWPSLSSFSSLFSAPECALLALAAQGRESPSPPHPP